MYYYFFFFFNDTATPEIYTLSLHDALPISAINQFAERSGAVLLGRSTYRSGAAVWPHRPGPFAAWIRSEEHTSELQSQSNLVCRLLLEKKKKTTCIFKTVGIALSESIGTMY